jgi:hypothetical protein
MTMAAHNDIGAYGETLVMERLAQIAPVAPGSMADVLFMNCEIEVKTARPSRYNGKRSLGYQFSLRRPGHSEVRAPVVVLVCLPLSSPEYTAFVIPAEKLEGLAKVAVPLDIEGYAGLWAPYRERWEVIADFVGGN